MVSLKLRAAQGKVLRPIHPNIGIEVEYRHQMQSLIESMHHSIRYWIESGYRNNQPVLAQDSPASALKGIFDRLARRWRKTWNNVAGKLARYFSRQVQVRADTALQRNLRDAGLSIENFTTTEAMRDVLHAIVAQNVALIKSIPNQYLSEVEQVVMRSVQTGGDLDDLTEELEKRYQISHKRAAMIARSQNEMATASMLRVRQIEIGARAKWEYTWLSREPRPAHVRLHNTEYDPRIGAWDDHEKMRVFPGSLINCKCRSKIVL